MLRRFFILLVLMMPALAPAQAGQPEFPLYFTISTNRQKPDHYIIGEPVWLYLTLTNGSSQSLNVQTEPTLESDLHVEICTPATKPWTEIKKPFPEASFPSAGFNLLPFESRTFTIVLLYDRENRNMNVKQTADGQQMPVSWPMLVFDQESFFRINAQLAVSVNGSGKMPMKHMTEIEVKNPSPVEERLLSNMLFEQKDGKLIGRKGIVEACQRQAALDDETRSFFQRALDELPVTRYTPLFLYISASSGRFDTPEERQKVLSLYERLISEFPDHVLAQAAKEDVALLYEQTRESDKAYALIQEMIGPDRDKPIANLHLSNAFLARDGSDYDPAWWMLTP